MSERHLPDDQSSTIDPYLITSVRQTLAEQGAALQNLSKQLDSGQYQRVLNLIMNCKGHVILSGMGKSGHVGRKMSATLASTGTPSFFIHPAEAFHGDLGMITPYDLLILISASGETAHLAKTLADVTGGDLFKIRPQTAYTAADLDWNNAKSRSSVEMNDPKSRPAMAETPRLAGYDTVFVGFPIWWYQAPRIIQTFLESADFSGKTVIPFATSGGSGMGKTVELLRPSYAPDTRWNEGKRLSSHASAQEVSAWTKSLSL